MKTVETKEGGFRGVVVAENQEEGAVLVKWEEDDSETWCWASDLA